MSWKDFSWLTLMSLAILWACLATFYDSDDTEPEDNRFTTEVKSDDYVASSIEHDGCTYIVFKAPIGQSIGGGPAYWDTVSIVHDPKCKNCQQ